MEHDIQNKEMISEKEELEETEIEDHFLEECKRQSTEEPEEEKAFKDELVLILEKMKMLPTEAAELRMPSAAKDVEGIYTRLCKLLKVPESSAFLTQIENEKMDFSYQCLGPIGIIPVTKALIPCKIVKMIDLKYNKLGAESLPAIISLIEQNENITHLNLSGNGIGKGSAHILSELIARCFSVEFLDLSNNDLGDEELQELGMSLRKIDCVKELILSTNDFSQANAVPFGACINKCSALLKLELRCCHLEEGAASIFSGLKFSNLTVLDLASNGIPNEATPAMASGLRINKSLRELDISYNVISNKGAVTLAPGIKGSSTLETIRLAHNPIQGSAATTLLNSAGANLKLLDLSGIRVNLAFFKTLRTYAKTGREVKVLFGSEIRYDCFPRDLSIPDKDLTEDNVVTYMERLADEKGVSLRNNLKNIHATYITEAHEAASEEAEAAKKKDDQKPRPPEMTTVEFAKRLSNSAIAVPKPMAQKVAELLSEDGFVNMWKLIARVRWKPDDLNVKIKAPKKPSDEKTKKKGKKK